MKVTGYDSMDFEINGFGASLPPDFMSSLGVEPVILTRTGTFATFGPSEISELVIPVTFTILPSNTIGAVGSRVEDAFLYLFKRLNPYNTQPRQLRAERNNGTKIAVPAVMRIFSRSDSRNANQRFVDFVAVEPFSALTASTATVTF